MRGILWEELLSRNKQGIDFFVEILSQCTRKEGQEFRSLEVRGKLIALETEIVKKKINGYKHASSRIAKKSLSGSSKKSTRFKKS